MKQVLCDRCGKCLTLGDINNDRINKLVLNKMHEYDFCELDICSDCYIQLDKWFIIHQELKQ